METQGESRAGTKPGVKEGKRPVTCRGFAPAGHQGGAPCLSVPIIPRVEVPSWEELDGQGFCGERPPARRCTRGESGDCCPGGNPPASGLGRPRGLHPFFLGASPWWKGPCLTAAPRTGTRALWRPNPGIMRRRPPRGLGAGERQSVRDKS